MLMMYDLKNIQDWDLLKSSKFKPVSEKFNLKEAVDEVTEMMKLRCDIKYNILTLDLRASEVPTYVIGDKVRFQQVAINLLSNAINNTFEKSITLRVEYSKD